MKAKTMTLKALRERRAALAKETRNLLDQNRGTTWNADHQKKYDANMEEIERLDAEIDRHQKLMDKEAEEKFGAVEREAGLILTPGAKNASPERVLMQKWMRVGERGMSAEEATAFYNTMSTTTGSEGGYTVQTDIAKSVADALKAYGGMRAVAEVFRTAQGNPMQFPTSDGTSETGELIGENTTANDEDMVFGTVALNVYKFSSKVITVPIELLQDSSIDIEAFIAKRLGIRLGRVTNTYFTTGTGTNQPRGIVTALSTGKTGATGQTVTVIYDDLVDLQHSVDPEYRKNSASWMMHDSSLKVVRKLKDTAGRPIFVPSYDEGIAKGAPAELLGDQIQINQDMATMAANAKSIAYGDLSNYKIRDVMEMYMYRFTDSAYAKKGQVGFMAHMRAGGNWVDVGGGAKLYVNSAT